MTTVVPLDRGRRLRGFRGDDRRLHGAHPREERGSRVPAPLTEEQTP
jgi:hypothetical protein